MTWPKSTLGWSVFAGLLLAQVLMLASFLRMALELAGPLITAANERLGIDVMTSAVALVGAAIIAIGSVLITVHWMRRAGFVPESVPAGGQQLVLVAGCVVAAALLALLIPTALAAVTVLIVSIVARLILLSIAVAREPGGMQPPV
jgi:hypothetical protein